MTRPAAELVCPLCGGANECVPAHRGTFDVICWCMTTPVSAEARARLPKARVNKACICPRCAVAPVSATGSDA